MLLNEIDLKAEVPISQGFAYDKMVPDIRRVGLNYIRPILGKDLYSVISTSYAAETMTDDEAALHEYIKPAVAHLAVAQFVPKGNLHLGNNGLQAQHSSDSKPAFEHQVLALQRSLTGNGFDALDELIIYLESVTNTDFPDWLTSEGCTLVRNNFINSALDYNDHVPKIKRSRYLFEQVKPVMTRLEKKLIKSVVGNELYDLLKAEIQADGLSAVNAELVTKIAPAVAHLSWAESLVELSLMVDQEGVHMLNNTFSGTNRAKQPADPQAVTQSMEHHRNLGNGALEDLRAFLVENLSDYPLYEASSAYMPEQTGVTFMNDPESGVTGLI